MTFRKAPVEQSLAGLLVAVPGLRALGFSTLGAMDVDVKGEE
jgi:hypothetical protein